MQCESARDTQIIFRVVLSPPGGGGGEGVALTSQLDRGGGCRWGVKTWLCLKPLGAQKIHNVTIYLTKNFHMHTLGVALTSQLDGGGGGGVPLANF